MGRSRSEWLTCALVLLAVAVLPLLGWLQADRPIARLFAFPPPLEIPSNYPRFSWFAAALVLAAAAALGTLIALGHRRAGRRRAPLSLEPAIKHDRRRFPGWGWAALAWTSLWWVVAWTRFDAFAWGQRYTFFPLWLGFIVSVNALVWRRRGDGLMIRAPGRWLALFGASAAFWWGFEWLNRFARNWHYLGVEEFGPAVYLIHASLSFSTVLPAVAAVREWLGDDRWWHRAFAGLRPWPSLATRGSGVALVIVGAASLVLLGGRPQAAYAAIWTGPLALAAGLGLMRKPAAFSAFAAGDWRPAASWALAALICGFFWELWNVHSLAKWIYTVPYVDRWHVFEMPLLGYTGYLPFGLTCGLVTTWIQMSDARGQRSVSK